ncbi:MAG: LytR C-terminal domain-containing protein [Actinomycetaceae bacterium]|nr:LytR C-terminal domain-containing protein [Actinomycetaceae bacterium]
MNDIPPSQLSRSYRSPRLRFRKARQRRQNIAFSVIALFLALSSLFSVLVLVGLIPVPFFAEFEASANYVESGEVPCVPEGAKAAPLDGIVVKVLNATGEPGLAGTVGEKLAAHGVTLEEPGNYAGQFYGTVRIRAGASQVVNAYTLERLFPDASVRYTQSDSQVITIVLGEHFSSMLSDEEITALIESGDTELHSPKECKTVPQAGE